MAKLTGKTGPALHDFYQKLPQPWPLPAVHTEMELPSFSISHAGIRGQWLTFTLGVEAGTALRLQDSYLLLHELGRQELLTDIAVQPGRGFTTEVRFLLPPVSAHFPHIESNAMHSHAARLDKVLWLTEQAEHHGQVVFRLGASWHKVSVIVRV